MCKGGSHPRWAAMARSSLLQRPDADAALSRRRRTDPEIFTFDPIPIIKRSPAANPRLRSKRRAVKVLYPAQVRKYLPAEKADWTKRLLLLFLSVVIVQVYSATEANEEVANVVATVGAAAGVKPDLGRKWALGVSALSEEPFVPSNGLVPLMPKLTATGAEGVNPAGANPREIVACCRMKYGPIACRM